MAKSEQSLRVRLPHVLFVVAAIGYVYGAIATLINNHIFERITTDVLTCFVAAVFFMTIVFIFAKQKNRIDIIDAAWGPAFIVIGLTSFILGYGYGGVAIKIVVNLLVIVWGLRLSHSISRRLESHDEDKRYTELRKKWQHVWVNAYLRIFLSQAVLALVISIAVIHVDLFAKPSLSALSVLGVVIWCVGFFFEVVGDRQLRTHLANPKNKGKLLTSGLWRYTRHPNYFGEVTMWVGIGVIALSTPFGWVGLATPVTIAYLILFVSGVPLTEKTFEGRVGWEAYKKRTSSFLPLPPKK